MAKPSESQNLGDDDKPPRKHPYNVTTGHAAGLAAGQKAFNIGQAQVHKSHGWHAGTETAEADLSAMQGNKARESYALQTYGRKTLSAAEERLFDAELAREKKSRFDPNRDRAVNEARAAVAAERRAPIVAAELAEVAELEKKLELLRVRALFEQYAADPQTKSIARRVTMAATQTRALERRRNFKRHG